MPRRLAVSVGFTGNPDQVRETIDRIKVAEEVGVEAVFTAETWGRDQFSLLTRIALETSKIRLGTGIAPVYGRSPAVLAMTAATLDELSGGRMILGLGTSGQRVIEHWHGEPFGKPLQRLKEYCEVINIIVSGEKLHYEGEIFKLQRGFKLLFEPVRNHIPIYVASISPASIRQLGQFADGWMPIYWPKSKFMDGKAQIAEGLAQAGRPADAVECVASLTTVIDSDAKRARMQAAGPVSFYVTRMGDFYHQMLTRNGFGDEVQAIQAAYAANEGDPGKAAQAAAAAVSDRMADETAIFGDIETVAAGIEERRQLGVDLPVISMPAGDLREIEHTLGTLVA